MQINRLNVQNAASLDDVKDVATYLRRAFQLPASERPDRLLPSQMEWETLSPNQRITAVQIWIFAERANCLLKSLPEE